MFGTVFESIVGNSTQGAYMNSQAVTRDLMNQEIIPITETGSRIGDIIYLYPFDGGMIPTTLNRTKYEFRSTKSSAKNSKCTKNCSIYIKSLKGKLSFDLTLVNTGKNQLQDGRYILRSNNAIPFRLNGIYCYEAYISRNDTILLGYVKIIFRDEDQKKKRQYKSTPPEILDNKSLIQSDLNIVIEGETGTGKTWLAQQIHQQSKRKGPFVHINLAAFSPTLIESELFGHIKGAFTGASGDKKGALLQANYGTLFLDEIDSIGHEVQIKLLLFLDSKDIRPVGGSSIHHCNTRLIFASGQDMRSLVINKKIRSDFYFRLFSGHRIKMAPLRNNHSKTYELCKQVEFNHKINIPQTLIEFYQKIPWPGNIRQLLSHLEKKIILAKGNTLIFDKDDEQLIYQDFKELHSNTTHFQPLQRHRDQYAFAVYKHFEDNINLSAKVLKISQKTLRQIVARERDVGAKPPSSTPHI